MATEEARGDDDSSQRPPKRRKYIEVACNECRRRKLKCEGGTVCPRCVRSNVPCVYSSSGAASTQDTSEAKDDRVGSQFREVDLQLGTLLRDVQTLSARVRELEPESPTASSKASASVHAAPGDLDRILNPPQSPSYVGPTSAEFGLGPQRGPLHENVHDAELVGDKEKEGTPIYSVTETPTPSAPAAIPVTQDPLLALGLKEMMRLVQVYEDTVGIIYPCVDLASLRTYAAEYYHSHQPNRYRAAKPVPESDQDWFHARDVQVLKILLATALLIESHGQSEQAAQLEESVQDRFASRLKIPQVDMKEILILTLLAIFHSYRDDEVIAWRLTGMAARGTMELGLHRQETWQNTGGVFPGALEWMWASRLFWCIYVLDRKWSIGTGLPFAIHDFDMDTDVPEPGHSTPYLTCMISYARLSAKIWWHVVVCSDRSREATSEARALLDVEVQQWVQSIPDELRFDPTRVSPPDPKHAKRDMMLQVLLALQANQLRILVYRQSLLSSERIAEDTAGASTAVKMAKRTVHILEEFVRVSDMYFQRPEPFNYFLISALAAFFLAMLHAPARFSRTCRPEFSMAVNLVRGSATRARTSRRLQKLIHCLKTIQIGVQWDPHHNESASELQPHLADDGHDDELSQERPASSRVLSQTTPLSSSAESPPTQNVPLLCQPSGIPTPQPSSAAFWPLSPGTAADAESNGCEDLSSFFEFAGGCYFGTQEDTDVAAGVEMGLSQTGNGRVPSALDAFQAEDERLTRVMAGFL